MFKGLTFRSSIALVLAAFFAILLVVSASGAVALKLGNDALREMDETGTESLVSPEANDALFQRARLCGS
ncbi:MAG TPA: Tar ligand binding domain-containing protein [Paraburkholderia sp.]|uniref:Tar ligand binding domain-containing protein n=1 Tax=Paraburkholderia sp. TaxID=1926495 RepID=UPI002B4A1373|nr:Tar ligand binding domain-containing protein [Paraburkholderia sp.]HKR44904.1 Tar ligand binding domain-containing protein [Paraburkholderia sp.]